MVWLRSSVFQLAFWGSVMLFGSLIMMLSGLVSARTLARVGRAWARLVLWLLRVVCGLRYRVTGREHLPDVPSVVLCKHQSTWETIALRTILPLDQTWVLKQELLGIPFFGGALARFHPIAIDRSAGRAAMRKLLAEGCAHLGAGRWVVVFPEGTRVAPGAEHKFSVGGALLAERAAVPVVPVAHNAGLFWGRNRLLKSPGCIELRIGPPIAVSAKGALRVNAEAEAWIRGAMAELPTRP